MSSKIKCECSDPGCPMCHGKCGHDADCIAFRSDMEDRTGTPMCDDCAEDALQSGVFYTRGLARKARTA